VAARRGTTHRKYFFCFFVSCSISHSILIAVFQRGKNHNHWSRHYKRGYIDALKFIRSFLSADEKKVHAFISAKLKQLRVGVKEWPQ